MEGQVLIGFEELRRRYGAGRTAGAYRLFLWRAVRAGRFPAPVRMGRAAIAWRAADVEAWVAALPRVSYAGADSPQAASA